MTTRDALYRSRAAARVRSRALPRVALVTCRELPVGDEDGPALQAACSAAGLDADWRVWDDPAVDWGSYDLVVIRSTWDYTRHRDDFVAWATSVPRLANPADVVAWNTEKTYLRELADAGLPVVPTTWLEPGVEPRLPEDGEYVVKPAVGAGARHTARYGPEHGEQARRHAAGLLAAGERVMVQPYLAAVDQVGETALLYCGGGYSHAIRKAPLLTGPDPDVPGLYRPETVEPREPSEEERAVAEAALAAVPGGPQRLLYARVDLLPGPDGEPLLLELELTEPSFFLTASPGAADRFARAVAAAVAASPTGPSGR
jgi:glutathione synthase/RimK-type ligase-like ATP-grasp enzyme